MVPVTGVSKKTYKEAQDEETNKAAVIFMVSWFKRRGVPCQKVLDLTNWNTDEVKSIHQIYKYSY